MAEHNETTIKTISYEKFIAWAKEQGWLTLTKEEVKTGSEDILITETYATPNGLKCGVNFENGRLLV